MSTDTLRPTDERLAKAAAYDEPRHDQTTSRPAFRVLSQLDFMARAGTIERQQYEAGKKLERHYRGMHGADVRMGDGSGGEPLELPQTYHAQQITRARDALLPVEWDALEAVVVRGETLEAVGARWRGVTGRHQRVAYGTALMVNGLERLAKLWGLA